MSVRAAPVVTVEPVTTVLTATRVVVILGTAGFTVKPVGVDESFSLIAIHTFHTSTVLPFPWALLRQITLIV